MRIAGSSRAVGRRGRLVWLIGLLATCLAVWAAPSKASPTATPGTDPACGTWSAKTLVQNVGVIEELEFDRRGGLLFSFDHPTDSSIKRLDRGGRVTTLVPSVYGPGGQRLRGHVLFFNTGDLPWDGWADLKQGTIDTYDLSTGRRQTWARNLIMPNSLAFLPNGDAVVSRDLNGPAGPTGITRVPHGDPTHPQYNWVPTTDSNGMAIDPTGTWLYYDQNSADGMPVWRARISDPAHPEVVASLGSGSGLDDMTIDKSGVLYVTRNAEAGAGEVIRLDPRTGTSCVIAGGMNNTSAAKFGCGPGWPSNHLFVVAFDGTIRELTPPPGATVAGFCPDSSV